MSRIAVIDTETANNKDKGSICSIGIVFMHGMEIVDTYYSLVQPLHEFTPMNIKVHGIRPEHVADSPTFAQLWPELWPRLQGYSLICYNASSDVYAIERALYNAGIETPNFRYACAMNLTKRLVQLDSYSLSGVASHFGITFDAHNALEDATSTAQILQALGSLHSADDMSALMRLACMPYQYALSNDYDPAQDKVKKVTGYVAPKPLAHGNSEYFVGKSVVFSGTLTCAMRDIAQQAVEEMGGVCKTAVSRKTDVVVIGFYDQDTLLPGCSYGSKVMKAMDLKEQGHQIDIIDENEFMEILNEGII